MYREWIQPFLLKHHDRIDVYLAYMKRHTHSRLKHWSLWALQTMQHTIQSTFMATLDSPATSATASTPQDVTSHISTIREESLEEWDMSADSLLPKRPAYSPRYKRRVLINRQKAGISTEVRSTARSEKRGSISDLPDLPSKRSISANPVLKRS